MNEGQPFESNEVAANRWGALENALAGKKLPFLSEEEVTFAFERLGGNARAAAEFLGVNHQSLINYAREFGLPIGVSGRPSVTDEWGKIKEAWENGASAEEIREQFGVEAGTTRQHARRSGWTPHKPGARRKDSD